MVVAVSRAKRDTVNNRTIVVALGEEIMKKGKQGMRASGAGCWAVSYVNWGLATRRRRAYKVR